MQQGDVACPVEGQRALAVEQHHGAAQEQADVGLVGVADAAVQLDRLAGHQHGRFGGAHLGGGHQALHLRSRGALVQRGGRFADDGAGQFDLQFQVDHAVLQRLEAADLAAELAAYAEIVAGLFESRVHQPHQVGGAGQRRLVEGSRRGFDELRRRAVEPQARQVATVLGRFPVNAQPLGVALYQREAGVAGH
ncbi:hypothetical protein D3C78_1155080 [compost metagenome]